MAKALHVTLVKSSYIWLNKVIDIQDKSFEESKSKFCGFSLVSSIVWYLFLPALSLYYLLGKARGRKGEMKKATVKDTSQ